MVNSHGDRHPFCAARLTYDLVLDPDDTGGIAPSDVLAPGMSPGSTRVKRAFDVVVAALMLVAAAPLMLVIALMIRCDSRGPVLRRVARVGRSGEVFALVRFRTTAAGPDAAQARLHVRTQAAAGLLGVAPDPWVTRAGRWLRRLSLDELPQLFNVLCGHMSLVGPRPVALAEAEAEAQAGAVRLHLTPGMTGPWQRIGGAALRPGVRTGLDDAYVAGWSLWRDMRIVLSSVAWAAGRLR